MNYLRMGAIPEHEKSINWRKLSLDQRNDLLESIEVYNEPVFSAVCNYIKYNNSWKNLDINDIFENGVSVFRIDENNNPILDNDKLKLSYEIRKNLPAYIVSGDEVGIGEDGEPLLQNVKVLHEI